MNVDTPFVSERVEAAVLKALHAQADDELQNRLGLKLETTERATLMSVASEDPSILLNRIFGLGLETPTNAEELERICATYRNAGIDRFFMHVHPEARPGDMEALLEGAGLEPYRRWMKFERGSTSPPTVDSDLKVREIGADEVDAFGRIAASGFGLTQQAALLFRGLVGLEGFHLYITFDGDTPAGTGLLYIDGEVAWLDWAATDPNFRGRGSQRALLARRIQDAVDAGCERLMTCTGEAVPGDPQHSYHNIEWAGFEPKFLRENWIPQRRSR